MPRLLSLLSIGAAAIAAGAVIAACGSGSPRSAGAGSGSSHPTRGQVQRLQRDAIKFTDCMRAHGIAGFPDPPTAGDPSSGRIWKSAFTNRSPGFVSAATACRHFMPAPAQHQSPPNTSAQLAPMLAFARCIRSHGFPSFPDPTGSGITHELIASAGIDLHQPAVLTAADACVGVTHGLITRAAVARFISGH